MVETQKFQASPAAAGVLRPLESRPKLPEEHRKKTRAAAAGKEGNIRI